MPTTTNYVPSLYVESTQVDEKTGLPQDYDSFAAAYRPLALSVAERIGIPIDDRENAVQEVQLKFWRKNGLDLFDPNMDNRKFGVFFRAWAGKFLLQERDKTIRIERKHIFTDPLLMLRQADEDDSFAIVDPEHLEDEFLSSERSKNWLEQARAALREVDDPDIPALFELCVEYAQRGATPTRAAIIEHFGCTMYRATNLLYGLRTALTQIGMGVESLYG